MSSGTSRNKQKTPKGRPKNAVKTHPANDDFLVHFEQKSEQSYDSRKVCRGVLKSLKRYPLEIETSVQAQWLAGVGKTFSADFERVLLARAADQGVARRKEQNFKEHSDISVTSLHGEVLLLDTGGDSCSSSSSDLKKWRTLQRRKLLGALKAEPELMLAGSGISRGASHQVPGACLDLGAGADGVNENLSLIDDIRDRAARGEIRAGRSTKGGNKKKASSNPNLRSGGRKDKKKLSRAASTLSQSSNLDARELNLDVLSGEDVDDIAPSQSGAKAREGSSSSDEDEDLDPENDSDSDMMGGNDDHNLNLVRDSEKATTAAASLEAREAADMRKAIELSLADQQSQTLKRHLQEPTPAAKRLRLMLDARREDPPRESADLQQEHSSFGNDRDRLKTNIMIDLNTASGTGTGSTSTSTFGGTGAAFSANGINASAFPSAVPFGQQQQQFGFGQAATACPKPTFSFQFGTGVPANSSVGTSAPEFGFGGAASTFGTPGSFLGATSTPAATSQFPSTSGFSTSSTAGTAHSSAPKWPPATSTGSSAPAGGHFGAVTAGAGAAGQPPHQFPSFGGSSTVTDADQQKFSSAPAAQLLHHLGGHQQFNSHVPQAFGFGGSFVGAAAGASSVSGVTPAQPTASSFGAGPAGGVTVTPASAPVSSSSASAGQFAPASFAAAPSVHRPAGLGAAPAPAAASAINTNVFSSSSTSKPSAVPGPPPDLKNCDLVLLADTRESRAFSATDLSTASEMRALPLGDMCWVWRTRTSGSDSSGSSKMVVEGHQAQEQEEILAKYLVERKSVPDLDSSIRDGRYTEQKRRFLKMPQDLVKLFYLVESKRKNNFWEMKSGGGQRKFGQAFDERGLPHSTICAALLHTQFISGIRICRTQNPEHTMDLLKSLTAEIKSCGSVSAIGDGGGKPDDSDSNVLAKDAPQSASDRLRQILAARSKAERSEHDQNHRHNFYTYSSFAAQAKKTADLTARQVFGRQLRHIDGCGEEAVEQIVLTYDGTRWFSGWRDMVRRLPEKTDAEWLKVLKEAAGEAAAAAGEADKKPRSLNKNVLCRIRMFLGMDT